jgi:hypothetical protein
MKVSVNFINERDTAAPVISPRTSHALFEFTFAIDDNGATIGQL